MEQDNFENKIMQDLRDSMTAINKTIDEGLKGIDIKLKKELGAKGFARWKAFNTKFLKLKEEGKELEAKELEKTYIGGEQI